MSVKSIVIIGLALLVLALTISCASSDPFAGENLFRDPSLDHTPTPVPTPTPPATPAIPQRYVIAGEVAVFDRSSLSTGETKLDLVLGFRGGGPLDAGGWKHIVIYNLRLPSGVTLQKGDTYRFTFDGHVEQTKVVVLFGTREGEIRGKRIMIDKLLSLDLIPPDKDGNTLVELQGPKGVRLTEFVQLESE